MKVDVNVGKPTRRLQGDDHQQAEARGKHKKQTGGRGQFGDCDHHRRALHRRAGRRKTELEFKDGFAFENKIFGGSIPKEYIPSVEYGCRETAKSGVLAGYPLINVKVTLIDGSYHEVDSSQVAFEQAGAPRLHARPARRPACSCSSRS